MFLSYRPWQRPSLAYNALQSAKTAADIAAGVEQTASAALASAAAATKSAEVASDTADTARRWLELSQKAFVAPTEWVKRTDRTGRPTLYAMLRDVAGVPAIVTRVCTWQHGEFLAYDRRRYTDATVQGGSLAYRSLHYEVPFLLIDTPKQHNSNTVHLGVVYTFSREDAPTAETWRVDAELDWTTDTPYSVRVVFMGRVATAPC